MDGREKRRLIVGILFNIAIIVMVSVCVVFFIRYSINGGNDNRFRYFTNISNITVALISIANTVLLIVSLLKEKIVIPKFFSIIKLIGITMTTLTFFVVLFVLAPATSFLLMYQDGKFFTHLLVPVFVVISFLFFEEKTLFEWKYSILGVVPPIIYSIVYTINVVYLKTWPDIYYINTQGIWYVFSIITCLLGFGLAHGLYFLKKLTIKKAA